MHACLNTTSGRCCGRLLFPKVGPLSTFNLSYIALTTYSSLTFEDFSSLELSCVTKNANITKSRSTMKSISRNHEDTQLTKSVLKEEEVRNNKLNKGKATIKNKPAKNHTRHTLV